MPSIRLHRNALGRDPNRPPQQRPVGVPYAQLQLSFLPLLSLAPLDLKARGHVWCSLMPLRQNSKTKKVSL